jgi:hypothetical protein
MIPGTWRVEVLLDATIEEARGWVPAHAATLEETPEGVVLRDYADNLDWMARLLVALGCPFTIREPPELWAALRRLAARIQWLADAPVTVDRPKDGPQVDGPAEEP